MKKTTKIMAVVLTLIMLLSTAPLFASAKTQSEASSDVWTGDDLVIDTICRAEVGEKVYIEGVQGANYYYLNMLGDSYYTSDIDFYTSSQGETAFVGNAPGIAVIECSARTTYELVDGSYKEIDSYIILLIVGNPDDMGEVTGIKHKNFKLKYQDGIRDDWFGYSDFIYANVSTKNRKPANYVTIFNGSDNEKIEIDQDGRVSTNYKGSVNCNVFVVDAQGNVFKDTCKVTVKLTFWQLLLRFIMPGGFPYPPMF